MFWEPKITFLNMSLLKIVIDSNQNPVSDVKMRCTWDPADSAETQ